MLALGGQPVEKKKSENVSPSGIEPTPLRIGNFPFENHAKKKRQTRRGFMVAPGLPDEIISEILTPVLHVSNTPTETSPFLTYEESTSHCYLKICVEGGFGASMHGILKNGPNVTDICISLHLHASDSSAELVQDTWEINSDSGDLCKEMGHLDSVTILLYRWLVSLALRQYHFPPYFLRFPQHIYDIAENPSIRLIEIRATAGAKTRFRIRNDSRVKSIVRFATRGNWRSLICTDARYFQTAVLLAFAKRLATAPSLSVHLRELNAYVPTGLDHWTKPEELLHTLIFSHTPHLARVVAEKGVSMDWDTLRALGPRSCLGWRADTFDLSPTGVRHQNVDAALPVLEIFRVKQTGYPLLTPVEIHFSSSMAASTIGINLGLLHSAELLTWSYPAQHHALTKIILTKRRNSDEDAEWDAVFFAIQPAHFPSLLEVRVAQCEWPATEHVISLSMWVRWAEFSGTWDQIDGRG
ncbi:hypothetical protein DFH07DRAFT_942297 [Mycena maculata]|uniref:Uncharacterized protein n=1 Tax=Mycena maculata TaxID=230809 RepID=A0AAD7IQT8_9AGAR|nr:hypothetical protein DFH07DRAFT_942297 [Mycena maculata]